MSWMKIKAIISHHYVTYTLLAVLAIACGLLYIKWNFAPTVVLDTRTSSNVLSQSARKLQGTEATKQDLQQLVDGDPNIVAVQLVSTDFEQNARKTLFLYADDPVLKAAVDTGIDSVSNSAPFFIYFNEVNNNRMIRLLSEEMYCYESKISYIAQLAPTLVGRAPWFCSIAIPPSKWFAGYLNIYMLREPLPEEKNKLQFDLENISNRIYQREGRPG
jgi:hypothetical protein